VVGAYFVLFLLMQAEITTSSMLSLQTKSMEFTGEVMVTGDESISFPVLCDTNVQILEQFFSIVQS
jgi:hypothetical protein